MFRRLIYSAALFLAASFSSVAASPFAWDLGVNVTTQYSELEVGCLPAGWQKEAGALFGPLRLSAGLVVPQGDHPNGVRVHLDTFGADRGPFLMAGLFLSAGQDLGGAVGARFGAGYRFQHRLRLAAVVDGVAGTHKSQGSVGIQAAYTF